jgi:hypothetical protein
MRWCFSGCLLVALLDGAVANVTDESLHRTGLEERRTKLKQFQGRLVGVWRPKGTADEWHFHAHGRAVYRWDDGQDYQDDRHDYRIAYGDGHIHLDIFDKREGKYLMRPGIARFQGQQLIWVLTENWHELPERQANAQNANVLVHPTTFNPSQASEGIREVLEYDGKLP